MTFHIATVSHTAYLEAHTAYLSIQAVIRVQRVSRGSRAHGTWYSTRERT